MRSKEARVSLLGRAVATLGLGGFTNLAGLPVFELLAFDRGGAFRKQG